MPIQSIAPGTIACPGLFHTTRAQDGSLFRIRTPGGRLTSTQGRVIAQVAKQLGDRSIQITNRANLQIRTLQAEVPSHLLTTLQVAGLAAPIAAVDHLRNIMSSPTAGIDVAAVIDPYPIVTALDRYISTHPELAGLSAKFSVGLDGGEAASVRDRPNDIWLVATSADQNESIAWEAPVYFRLYLSLEQDQELDTGILAAPDDCVSLVAAIAQVYLDRLSSIQTDGKPPRLRQVIQMCGTDWYLNQLMRLPFRLQAVHSEVHRNPVLYRHLGAHSQCQRGLSYVGVVVPLGQLTAAQLTALADLAETYGSGALRLTPWQNLLIPDIPDDELPEIQREIDRLGLSGAATHPWSAIVACAGSPGCAASATQTQLHALALADQLNSTALDRPLNVHFSGCPKSCAQHHTSDIALLGTSIQGLNHTIEGYHIYVGAGDRACEHSFGRELFTAIAVEEIPSLIQRLLHVYQSHRSPDESFAAFVNRHPIAELRHLFNSAGQEL